MSESSSKSSQPLASKQEKDGAEKRGRGRPRKQPPKEPSEVPTPKRPRGRPKGSKNKGAAKTRKTTTTPGRKPRGRPKKLVPATLHPAALPNKADFHLATPALPHPCSLRGGGLAGWALGLGIPSASPLWLPDKGPGRAPLALRGAQAPSHSHLDTPHFTVLAAAGAATGEG